MALRLPKNFRNFVFRARKRGQRYYERKWLATEHGEKFTTGTFYRNFAGEKFKITRERVKNISVLPHLFRLEIYVDVLKGNKGLGQSTIVNVNTKRRIVEIANLNADHAKGKAPSEELRGRNVLGMVVEECELMGREFFGKNSFKIIVDPATYRLKKFYRGRGFFPYKGLLPFESPSKERERAGTYRREDLLERVVHPKL